MATLTATAATTAASSSTSIAARRLSSSTGHESNGIRSLSSRHRTGSTSTHPQPAARGAGRVSAEEWVELEDIPLERVSTAIDSIAHSGNSTIADDVGSTTRALPQGTPLWDRIVKFWKANIGVSVDMRDSRDHLALERTFLAYLRTSAVGAVTGTTISQLFMLSSDAQDSGSGFTYSAVGKPLATVCYVFAILTITIGTYRVWRLQHAILEGKTLARGAEPMTIFVVTACLLACLAGITIALDFVA
ncbi:hypothetical protein BROUX41_006517 [Berkeleyomyces rouxiae]